jgi:hypothetical protein
MKKGTILFNGIYARGIVIDRIARYTVRTIFYYRPCDYGIVFGIDDNDSYVCKVGIWDTVDPEYSVNYTNIFVEEDDV